MAVATQQDTEVKQKFDDNLLSEKERSDLEFVKNRILDLKEARQQEQYNVKIERIWADADRDYAPHRLPAQRRRRGYVEAADETKGWRSPNIVQLGTRNWQSDIAQANPYIKIQTALSILVDQNPTGVFSASSKKYAATTELMSQLYERSWEHAKSKPQLKLFVYNLCKYGFAIARTYPLRVARKTKNLITYDPEDPENSVYEEKEVVEFNDIFRENLDPWNVWLDDMAKPSHPFAQRDWCWRKVYPWDVASEEFGKYPNWKYVVPGGITTEKIGEDPKESKKFKERKLVEVYFYENRLKDLFMVVANGVPVVIEPLPVSDAQGVKKLSCWWTFWTLRHAESVYGIGIYEAIRYDNALLDRIRNQSIDQLTLSIYKMFFYQGTQALKDTGDIVIQPGVGKQVLDPKNIQFLQVPGPGREAVEWIDRFKKDIEDSSGITETLQGIVQGKTAFEIAQAKESALKRLKGPLDNILDALNTEAYITISLAQLLYSIPEVIKITDETLIDDYIHEIEADPELYERDKAGNFIAKIYPEFPLNLDKDEKGNLIPTEESRFFRIKPRFLDWEGMISVKAQSILTPSKQVDKALDLEMFNILIPLMAQPPELYLKAAKSIVKIYDKDPRDILPDSWLQPAGQAMPQDELGQAGANPQDQNQPLIVPQGAPQIQNLVQGGVSIPGVQPASERLFTRTIPPTQAPQAPQLTPSVQVPQQPQSLTQRIASRLTRPFR